MREMRILGHVHGTNKADAFFLQAKRAVTGCFYLFAADLWGKLTGEAEPNCVRLSYRSIANM